MISEVLEHTVEIHLARLQPFLSYRTLHQQLHTVAHHHSHFFNGTLRQLIRPQGIIAAGSQIFKRRNQGAVKVEDVCFKVKLSMWRELLDAEITAMKHMNLTLIDTLVKRTVSTILPALESLGVRIHNDVLEFYRSINRSHIDRQYPFMLAQRLHLQEMIDVPVAQRRMIAQ